MKTFKQFAEEVASTSTGPGIVGTSPGDPPHWKDPKKKKKKYKMLTRSFIEIMGKRKRQVK